MNDRPIVYVEDGITRYRASSLLTCPRAFIYARSGESSRIPPNLAIAFAEGHDAEPRVVEMLSARGHHITASQRQVDIAISGGVEVVGHIDGTIDGSLLEIKALSQDNFEKFLDDYPRHFPYYAWQISAYMIGGGFSAAKFAILNKATSELRLVSVDEPPIDLPQIINRIQILEDAWLEYQLRDITPPCETVSFCPYWHLHKEHQHDEPDSADLSTLPELEDLVVAYSVVQKRLEVLQAGRETLRERIITSFDALGKSAGSSPLYSVSLQRVQSKRLDGKKVKELLGDRYDDATTITTTTRLTVKEK